jgi:hypothetical protein
VNLCLETTSSVPESAAQAKGFLNARSRAPYRRARAVFLRAAQHATYRVRFKGRLRKLVEISTGCARKADAQAAAAIQAVGRAEDLAAYSIVNLKEIVSRLPG